MRIVTVKMPEILLEAIDRVVAKGMFTSRSEFIRYAVTKALRELGEDVESIYREEKRTKTVTKIVNPKIKRDSVVEIVIGSTEVSIFADPGLHEAMRHSHRLRTLMKSGRCVYEWGCYRCKPTNVKEWIDELVMRLSRFYRTIVVHEPT